MIRTIEAHVGGQPLRLIVDGAPTLTGRTMALKRQSLERRGDALRRAVVLEPRGHADMTAALLTEPVSPAAHAGLLFMDADGWPALSGHAVIAATTLALERGLIVADGETLTFDTVAGAVHARARLQVRGADRRVDAVAVTGVPSFVLQPGYPLRAGARDLRVDVAYGGQFYAIVDAEATGIPVDGARSVELRRLGAEICRAVNGAGIAVHPAERELSGLAGVVFTGAPNDPEAHLRNVTVSAGGSIDRSPSLTGTAAVMAVLDAMGLLADGMFVHESITGSLHRGRIVRHTQVGELDALVPEIEGTAWPTGEQTFFVDEDDPLRDGFRL